ncbi:MAG TPA: hypothetical protein VNT60_11370, partial [Deinococcales bacterium]|nr:hypothetical protein [Deinococcales bacterium]
MSAKPTLKPVAFAGPDAAEVVRRLYALTPRFLPVEVPTGSSLQAALAGLAPLGFLGAVLSGQAQLDGAPLVDRR